MGETEMPKKILCAVDGSKASKAAAACAVELAKATGSKLTFLNVNVVPVASRRTHFWDASLVSAAQQQTNKQLAAAAKIAKAAKVEDAACAMATGGSVAKAIVGYADKNGFTHIVMGTGVTSELQRIFLGSVASWVIGHASCPVTVCRA
jgi:nucleotide-binding universal stress UspA family protein